MLIHAIACALPHPQYYLVLHAHVDARRAVWQRDDLPRYLDLQRRLEQLHRHPEAAARLPLVQRRALLPPGVSLEQALQRLVPYLVEADRHTKSTSYLHADTDSVALLRQVGVGVPHGLHFAVLVKKATGLTPTPQMLVACRPARQALQVRLANGELRAASEYRPGLAVVDAAGQPVELDTLAFRTDPHLVNLVRQRADDSLVSEGQLKVVAYPADAEVRLSANRGGEVIKEIAREWS